MKQNSRQLAQKIRAHALQMVYKAKASHIGSCLSMADLLAVLYNDILRIDPSKPNDEERDRFLLSKGHGAAILYAVLAERGYFSTDWLATYCDDRSLLAGHATHHGVPGVEISTGSLGHGLPIGCGMALAAWREGLDRRVFVLLSDGELDEGSNWEAILFAPQHRLENLLVIVDYNKIQSFGAIADVMELEPLVDKWRAFRWGVEVIDGHDHDAIRNALNAAPFEAGRPSVIIANTIKGKGVDFMENKLLWHYRSPQDDELVSALACLGAETL